MKFLIGIIVIVLALAAGIFLFSHESNIAVGPAVGANTSSTSTSGMSGTNAGTASGTAIDSTGTSAAAPATSTVANTTAAAPQSKNDLPPQPQLSNPPAVVKGIYLTGWSAGSASKVASTINLIKSTELNAVVVDIKDYSGYVSYAMDVPEVAASGAEGQIRIARPNTLIKELHDNGIYVIGRITSFQDPILAKAHPEWALHNKATGGVWTDNNGLAWMDPAAEPVRDYLAAIARDAFARGFDEVQFDYTRFASDGSLGNISYPYWDGKTPMASVIASYFKFLRGQFPTQKLSADLFGLSTVNNDDLGIGQVIQDAYEYFDYVSPMVYPSHYAAGFLGYKNPASYPYQVIDYSLTHGLAKLVAMGNSNSTPATASGTGASAASGTANASGTAPAVKYSPFNLGYVPNSKLRPWLQDFDLNGVPYTAAMVRQEKQAVYDVLNTATSSQYYGGWLLWNAANNYTTGALDPK